MHTAPTRTSILLLRYFVLLFALTGNVSLNAQLTTEGIYSGSHFYFTADETSCITPIPVNGRQQAFTTGRSVEADLQKARPAIGDSVHFALWHTPDSRPKMLPPPSLRRIDSSGISPDGSLYWTVVHPGQTTRYLILQYRWNQWDSIAMIVPQANVHSYTFKPARLHSGDNRFRIVALQQGQQAQSEELHIHSCKPAIVMTYYKKEHYVVFSTPTFFRLYNESGALLLETEEQSFRTDVFPKGIYFVLFDDQTQKIRL